MGTYRRGKNFYIDFTFHGERIREMIGPSRKGAEAVIAKRKTEIVEGKFLDIRRTPVPITFHDFAVQYRAWAKTNKKSSTCIREISIMRSLDAYFKGKQLQDITDWHIETWKSKRREAHKPATVNRELYLLKHMFFMAVKWKRLKENPAKEVKQLKGESKRVRYLLPDEVRILLTNCKDWLRPIVILAIHTGMRRGELLGLKWSQVDLQEGIISLFDTKNHETRYIPMDETVKGMLKGIQGDGNLVFSNRKGKQIAGPFLHLAFHEALKGAKISDFRFHDLRHTFASNLVMAGTDLYTVGELLGHKNGKMTRRYAHLAPAYKAKAVKVLDRVFDLSQNPPLTEKVVKLRP